MIAAQFCIQALNTSFFLLLNYYMVKEGYQDFEVARVISLRFMAVGLLAFPLGLYIKGRKLKPFFFLSSIIVPIFSILVIWAVDHQYDTLLYFSTAIWGIGFMSIQITSLPFILLNTPKEYHSEGISLSFLSFSTTIFIVGISYSVLNWWAPAIFTERNVLFSIAILAFIAVYFVSRIKIKEVVSTPIPFKAIRNGYDWKLILTASTPTLIIAIGAGFTIPVINLFFLNIHGVPSETFSLMGATTFFLVACVMIFMPAIKRRFGYNVAIILFQSLAILVLFGLATTEYYKEQPFAVYVAIFFYIIRQPLMNAAGPMTSELGMYYVGKRNQEIISALSAAIWSGSFFISTSLFSLMRQYELRYVTIFLITVGLYVVGVSWYAWIIRDYHRRVKKGWDPQA